MKTFRKGATMKTKTKAENRMRYRLHCNFSSGNIFQLFIIQFCAAKKYNSFQNIAMQSSIRSGFNFHGCGGRDGKMIESIFID